MTDTTAAGVTHRFVDADGIILHVAEQGEGPPVVFCHGFPHTWQVWSRQLPAIAALGYRAIAPDMRGYGRSGIPRDPHEYTNLKAIGDLLGLLDHLSEERATFVGLDFGAALVWELALRHPDRVRAAIVFNNPYVGPPKRRPSEAWATLAKDHFLHVHYFQQPGPADEELAKNPREFLARVYFALSGDYHYLDTWANPPASGYLDVLPQAPPLPWEWLSEAELDAIAADFERTGFTGGLNWYRAIDLNWEAAECLQGAPVTVPVYFAYGERDPDMEAFSGRDPLVKMRSMVADLRAVACVAGAGHLLQLERTAEVNALLAGFLEEAHRARASRGGSSGAWEAYRLARERLINDYLSLPPDRPVRLAKATSNLFRTRSRSPSSSLDATGFDDVVDIDPEARRADVGGLATYEQLTDATLAHGLIPLVVPELKTITLGGAVCGLGIESSSWRAGMPHESMLELDVLTGAGEVVTARPKGDNSDLFYGFPNSYGTLGYALRVKIELEPVEAYVHLRHLAYCDLEALIADIDEVCNTGAHAGEEVHFVDGTVFSPTESYLTLGTKTATAPFTSDYTKNAIYYRFIQRGREDWLTTRDYIWRWDTDWFWCSRAFGAQLRPLRRLWPRRLLRSDVYWRILSFEERHRIKARLDRAVRRPPRENVIQDVQIPVGRLAEFLTGFQRMVPISPIWLCPLRQRDPHARWDLYRLDPSTLYVNVGFWSSVPLRPDMRPDHHNRWVEDEVERLGGRKSLYSTSFYSEERFWDLYNGSLYKALKARYDPDARLLDLYDKCVLGR
jgi:pimeloyl-ACP methyl ester carboxylesterase/FAD/FMN-containing dehydrogenase